MFGALTNAGILTAMSATLVGDPGAEEYVQGVALTRCKDTVTPEDETLSQKATRAHACGFCMTGLDQIMHDHSNCMTRKNAVAEIHDLRFPRVTSQVTAVFADHPISESHA